MIINEDRIPGRSDRYIVQVKSYKNGKHFRVYDSYTDEVRSAFVDSTDNFYNTDKDLIKILSYMDFYKHSEYDKTYMLYVDGYPFGPVAMYREVPKNFGFKF